MARSKDLELYVVKWVDSWGYSKWTPRLETDATPEAIVSVGWVVADSKEGLTLASSMTQSTEQCNLLICIPKGSIVSITPIKNQGIKL